MAVPRRLSRKLQEVLGLEDGDTMSEWIDNVEALRGEVALRADVEEFRQEMHARLARIDARFESMDAKLDSKFAQLESLFRTNLAERNAELMKWAIGSWIASLAVFTGTMAAVVHFGR
jgi:hypothetical protein